MSLARFDVERHKSGAQVGHVAGLFGAVRSEISSAHPVAVRKKFGSGRLVVVVGGGQGSVQNLQDKMRLGPMGRSPVPR